MRIAIFVMACEFMPEFCNGAAAAGGTGREGESLTELLDGAIV